MTTKIPEVKEVAGFLPHALVSNPALIKITVIREKFVGQIEPIHLKADDTLGDVDIVGRTRLGWIIVVNRDGKLNKVDYHDYADCVRKAIQERYPTLSKDDALREAYEVVSNLPMLFTE